MSYLHFNHAINLHPSSESTPIRKSSLKNMYPIMENIYTRMRANTAVKTMDRPFLVTDRITLMRVSSRYTTSRSYMEGNGSLFIESKMYKN